MTRALHRQDGQVIVEQALVLPMMVFMILGIIQLTMIQHARIATEYAAYNAARSGIVYNGDPAMMKRAAFISLAPTFGRSDSLSKLVPTLGKAMLTQLGSQLADLLGLDILGDLTMIDVEILDHPDPAIGDRKAIMQQQGHLNKKQIDFDDLRTAPAAANQLTIQVRYYYEMRVPFANWFLQYMWLAQRAGVTAAYKLPGGGPQFVTPEGAGSHSNIKIAALALGDAESRAVMVYRAKREYRIPIKTWYTMRMQSNLYESHLGN